MDAKSVLIGLAFGIAGAVIVVALMTRNKLPGQKYVVGTPAVSK